MKETLLSRDFLLPLISIAIMLFLMVRLYSLRNMSYQRLITEFNIAFALGKLAYQLSIFVILAYLIVSIIKGMFLIAISATVLGVLIGRLLAIKIKLPPSTMISRPMMSFNCIVMFLVLLDFIIYIIKLI